MPRKRVPKSSKPAPELATLNSLPEELHDEILDYIFGASPSLKHTVRFDPKVNREVPTDTGRWIDGLRYPRRKELSELALVCPAWRTAVQSRLFCHSKSSTPFLAVHMIWYDMI